MADFSPSKTLDVNKLLRPQNVLFQELTEFLHSVEVTGISGMSWETLDLTIETTTATGAKVRITLPDYLGGDWDQDG